MSRLCIVVRVSRVNKDGKAKINYQKDPRRIIYRSNYILCNESTHIVGIVTLSTECGGRGKGERGKWGDYFILVFIYLFI